VTDRERTADGQFTDSEMYPDEAFRDVVAKLDLPTTGDVARAVGCERTTAYDRLKRLENDRVLESRRVGNALVWSIN